jgi:formylglycine-generating enzyme required for sulfatase activity
MIVIPDGRFRMGAPATDMDAEPEEQPRREVVIDKAFALGRYEVSSDTRN